MTIPPTASGPALTAAGWRITSFSERDGATLDRFDASSEMVRVPTRFVAYTATKGGLKLAGDGSVITGGADHGLVGQAGYGTEVWPREPAVTRSATVAGLVAGALAGWLVAAALAYRIRGAGRRRRWVATASSTVALAAAAVPAYVHYRDAYQVLVYAHGSPYPYIVYGPGDEIPVLAWTVFALVALIATASPPREFGRLIRS